MEHLDPPTGIETRLGWVLSGPVSGYDDKHTTVSLFASHFRHVDTVPVDSLDKRLKMFWELEALEIKEDETSVYDEFIESINLRDVQILCQTTTEGSLLNSTKQLRPLPEVAVWAAEETQ